MSFINTVSIDIPWPKSQERKAIMTMAKGIPYDKRPACPLVGEDGNAFSIIARAKKALKKAGLHKEAEQYAKEAMASDYDELLRVTMSYVRDESDDEDEDDVCLDCGEEADYCTCDEDEEDY